MKIKDLIFILLLAAIFLPFVFSEFMFGLFKAYTEDYGLLMSFLKFAILATLGESLGLRIKTGNYNHKGFGLLPRAFVWGFLGMFIFAAFKIFAAGVPFFLGKVGIILPPDILKADFCGLKLLTAFSISFFLNVIFAPVMMTFHKITDAHIEQQGGKLSALVKCIPMGSIFSGINWNVQWNFVFKKTIPFFWIPMHTITFLLPEEYQVLFAAVLGIALGVILAVASQLGKK